jgi:NADH:ubiquinone oxidoreductase subunit
MFRKKKSLDHQSFHLRCSKEPRGWSTGGIERRWVLEVGRRAPTVPPPSWKHWGTAATNTSETSCSNQSTQHDGVTCMCFCGTTQSYHPWENVGYLDAGCGEPVPLSGAWSLPPTQAPAYPMRAWQKRPRRPKRPLAKALAGARSWGACEAGPVWKEQDLRSPSLGTIVQVPPFLEASPL